MFGTDVTELVKHTECVILAVVVVLLALKNKKRE